MVDDLSFLSTPKLYYSYQVLKEYLQETLLVNMSAKKGEDITWYDMIINCDNNEDLSSYSNNFLQDYVVTLKKDILDFLEKLSTEYDFDFSFDDDTDLVDILKAHNFKPNVDSDDLLTGLLDFIVLTNKYCSFEAYVLLNFHCYFDEEEIEKIYDVLKYQDIEILIIESQNNFHSLPQENLYILDKDMCEIVEER